MFKWLELIVEDYNNLGQGKAVFQEFDASRLVQSCSVRIFDRSSRPMILIDRVCSGYTNQ